MNHHPDAPRIKLTESTDAKNGRLSDPRTKRTKEPHTMNPRDLIDQANHDRHREQAPSASAVTLYMAAFFAATYCAAVFLFTA